VDEVPREVLQRLAADNELDVELYRYGKELFRQQLAAYGPELERDMAELGRRNLLYRARATV
jgi:hypothetical protein